MYSKKVMEYFKNPKNVGEIKNPDGFGEVGNPSCGDVMAIYIKVGKDKKNPDKEIITDIKFKTFGCAAAIATSAMVTELAKGKTLEFAENISRNDVAQELDGLPPLKMHCSNLAADALREAIKDYRSKPRKDKQDKPAAVKTAKPAVSVKKKKTASVKKKAKKK